MEKEKKQDSSAHPSAKPPISGTPPHHSVLFLVLVSAFSFWKMPTWDEIDRLATVETFTTPLLPSYNSPWGICAMRSFFAIFSLGVLASRIGGPGIEIKPAPSSKSKLKPWKMTLKGWKSVSTFTWWSFLLLGLSFSASASISWLDLHDCPIPQWLLRFALLSFEISAPGAFLVSAVVKYALWPTSLKVHGPEGTKVFKSFMGLVTHNGNVIMILIELCCLSGIPVCLEHLAVSPIMGNLYVLFTWFMMHRWVPHEPGPKFVYFFLDTTLGKDSTIALIALLGVLFFFYLLFAMLCKFVLNGSSAEEGGLIGSDAILPRFVLLFGLAKLVCRFQD